MREGVHGPVSCTMMLGHLCLQVVPLMRGACFLDHCRSSEPAEEPRYASPCAWVVTRIPVHVVTLLKFSELARGVQSPHKDENTSPDMKQVGRVQFACGQMDDDPLQQRTAHIPAEERGEE